MLTVRTTRTVIGEIISSCGQAGLPVTQLNSLSPFSLNTKYNIGPGHLPTNIPAVRYVGIGNRGYYNVGDDGLANTYIPDTRNQDLHRPMPWRCRPLTEDLSSTERANYRMRTTETINGVVYVLYWLKRITIPSNSIEIKYVNADNQESDYNLTANLAPIPVPITDEADASTDGKPKIIVKFTGQFSITDEEIAEAVAIKYNGDSRYGKISEIGIYTGEDRNIQGVSATGTVNYTEAIFTHLAFHKCSQGNSDFSNINQTIAMGNGNLYLLQ